MDPENPNPPADPALNPAPPTDPAPEPATPWFQSEAVPPDWRDQIVSGLGLEGDDAKARLNQLARYQSIDKAFDALFHAQDKIRAGDAAAPPERPGEDADEAAWAVYREQIGLPATPEDYQLQLDDGLVLGDEDQAVMSEVFKAAHAAEIPPDKVSALTNAMLQARERQAQDIMRQHGLDQQQTTALLQKNWGSDYQANQNAVQGLVNMLPEGARETLENATTADGKMFFNDPHIMQWMADIARKLNPMGIVAPGAANPVAATESRIAQIEKMRDEDPDKYWKDQNLQAEYDRLLQAKIDHDALRSRGGA